MAKHPEKTAEKKAETLPAKIEETTKALATAPEGFEAFEGGGLENVTARDVVIPRLTIIQALSPQLKPKKPEFIVGATAGQICDVTMRQVWPKAIEFLPVYYVKQWLEWAPRNSDRGLVTIHGDAGILDRCTQVEDDSGRKKWATEDGNYIAETAQWFGLNLSADDRVCFLPMASTQLKKAKLWVSMATAERLKRRDGTEYMPPLFYRAYTLDVSEESKGDNDWFGWTIERGKTLAEHDPEKFRRRFDACVKLLDDLRRGAVQGDVRGMTEGTEPGGPSGADDDGKAM